MTLSDKQRRAMHAKRGQPAGRRARTGNLSAARKKGWQADFAVHGSAEQARTLAAHTAAQLDSWYRLRLARPGVRDDGKLMAELGKLKAEAARLHERLEAFTRRVEKAAYANHGRAAPRTYRTVTWNEEGELKDAVREDP